MRVVGGIDEAGLGPLLGPLCLGLAVFGLPDGERGGLRRALRGACVGSDAKIRPGDRRAVVCDSKALHRGARRLARLERTALAFLAAARGGELPATSGDVLRAAESECGALGAHPWYRDLGVELPLAADRDDVRRVAERILAICARRKVAILDLRARVLPERDLNALFARTRNKSLALFESVIPLFEAAAPHAPHGPVLVCDRHGGRASYAPLLSRAFGGAWVGIVREGPAESLYRVRAPGGTVRVAFARRGESRSFACALASCIAKYARELAMERFNAYFRGVAPEVRPTAGYFTDGKRFLREARPALAKVGIREEALVRTR